MSKIGRNELCLCGSGKKFKKCCLDKETPRGKIIGQGKIPEPPRFEDGRPRWNYEPCEAERGSVICGKSPRSTWWCDPFEGVRMDCIRITSGGDTFFILDDEVGRRKVFQEGGGPGSGHKSIPVDDPDSFVPGPTNPIIAKQPNKPEGEHDQHA